MTETTVETKTSNMPEIDMGVDRAAREHIADGLSRVLADEYTLYLKTHNYHWNVTGPHFTTLHALFEDHYQDMWAAVDEIAERIRTLGSPAPGTYKQFAQLTTIPEDDGNVPDWQTMVRNLVTGHEAVVKTIREVFDQADEAGDEGTVDVYVDRIRFHEQAAWMLRSILG